MRIHALARHPHLMEHLDAIHRHLPDGLRGERLLDHKPTISHTKHWAPDDIVMVAGFPDVDAAFGRRVAYVEHGAGQRYVGANPAAALHYHGSEHPENVIAYISPRQDVADSWGRPAFAAGSPICDPYQLFAPERVAAITFHWNASAPFRVGVPEAGTAFEHYAGRMADIVSALRDNDWQVIGTRHPQFKSMLGFWDRLGVPEADAHEVRERAQLLIADNTSVLYEMMYLGRDVVALNCPQYRRDVEHGLRFWEWAPAAQVDDPDELLALIPNLDKMIDRGEISTRDMRTTEYVYGKAFSDGLDGLRAATWLVTQLATI